MATCKFWVTSAPELLDLCDILRNMSILKYLYVDSCTFYTSSHSFLVLYLFTFDDAHLSEVSDCVLSILNSVSCLNTACHHLPICRGDICKITLQEVIIGIKYKWAFLLVTSFTQSWVLFSPVRSCILSVKTWVVMPTITLSMKEFISSCLIFQK